MKRGLACVVRGTEGDGHDAEISASDARHAHPAAIRLIKTLNLSGML
jgi:hypothetical protein